MRASIQKEIERVAPKDSSKYDNFFVVEHDEDPSLCIVGDGRETIVGNASCILAAIQSLPSAAENNGNGWCLVWDALSDFSEYEG